MGSFSVLHTEHRKNVLQKCTACIHRMQFKGLGISQQAFCNANGVCIGRRIACRCRRCIYVCPADAMKPLNVLSKFENHFAIRTVRFQVQLEADGYFSARKVFAFTVAASRASWYQLTIFESDFTNPTSKTIVGLHPNPISST